MAGKKSPQIKASTKVSGPELESIPEFEKPLLQVAITNPFKKILYWLDQIRRHQTTTFAIRLSIPLIAIPVIIAAAFSMGRVSGLSVLKLSPTPSPALAPSPQPPLLISKAGTLKVAKSSLQTTYLLSLKNGVLWVLEVPKTVDLTKYANKQILVTGYFNKEISTLLVTDIAEIRVFNELEIPESTLSASP